MEIANSDIYRAKPIIIVDTLVGSLSLIGSILTCVFLLYYKDFTKLASKIIFFLSISTCLCATSSILNLIDMSNENNIGWCYFQAFLIQFAYLSSFIWSTLISWTIFYFSVLQRRMNVNTVYIYQGIANLIPFLIAIMLF